MDNYRFRLLLSSLVALVAMQMPTDAQQLPRLVVCITVDQLRTDYLKAFAPMMGEGGLRRMLSEAKVYEHIDFPLHQLNAASATATLFTGVYPDRHGIEASQVYLRDKERLKHVFEDEDYLGNYSREQRSPKALLARTLGDRLKEASNGKALVYSIAPTSEQAIASAGELADGAYWLDEQIGAWAATNYYPQMLPRLEQYNRSAEGPNKRLASGLLWCPLRKMPSVPPTYSNWEQSFAYRYQSKDIATYRRRSIVNEELGRCAWQILQDVPYAQSPAPGLLAISYTVQNQGQGEQNSEDLDSYLRLDLEIQQLLGRLDRSVGLDNCLVTLSGTGYVEYSIYQDSKSQRLKRSINISRLTALANMYLTASFGQGEWIALNKNGRLYLNHKLIASKKLVLSQVQDHLAEFLSSAEGIAQAVSARQIQTSPDSRLRRIAHSSPPSFRADVYWSPRANWLIEDLKEHSDLSPRSQAISSPFLIMGKGIESGRSIYQPLDAREPIRIICDRLRIRPPND